MDIQEVFGPSYEDMETDLNEIALLSVITIFDIDSLIRFAQSVQAMYDGEDDEVFDFDDFNEAVWMLAGEALLAAKTSGWGGKTLADLYEYFELND